MQRSPNFYLHSLKSYKGKRELFTFEKSRQKGIEGYHSEILKNTLRLNENRFQAVDDNPRSHTKY